MPKMTKSILVFSYLAAIVAANNLVTYMGVNALLITAFFLIPFDLVARDQLQDSWQGKFLFVKMSALILSGSLIAYLLNKETENISKASAISFMIAGGIDFFIYSLLKSRHRLIKMNLSNVGSAICDSIVFQVLAFGSLSYSIAAQQSALKLFGGLFWSLLFVRLFPSKR